MGFVADTVAVGQVVLRVHWFSSAYHSTNVRATSYITDAIYISVCVCVYDCKK